jgi:serine/threonine protein kinase
MNRDDIELYVMGQYDGDVPALERAIADDPVLAQVAADEARFEVLLRDAATAATFCPVCDDLVRESRCDSCGAAARPGGYTIERVLVSNAHGRMYVARDADGTRVALKELAFVQAPSPGAVAAFEREVTFLRALEHPAIPRFVASFEEGSGVHTRYYLAQELVDGTALDRLDEHWYSEAEITALARQVLEILVYLQSLSPMVIHRDIKPANLVRRADGSIALVDFGAAHVHGTTAGITTIGTFGYMPIEQLAGLVDATTDVFALGMTLLHLLTRQEPWKLAQQRTTINASAPLRAYLDKLIAPAPEARFASAKDALAALDAPVKMKRRRPLAIAAVAGVAFAAAGGGVFALAHRGHSAAPTQMVTTSSTLQVHLPPDVAVGLSLDGDFVTRVENGQQVPVAAGHHHVAVGPCEQDMNLSAGSRTTIACDPASVATKPSNRRPSTPPIPRLHIDKKVTWLFDHGKVHDFVRIAAQTCGFSAVIPDSEDVDTVMSANITEAPCDQAFQDVLESAGLGYFYDPAANLVRVEMKIKVDDAEDKRTSTLPDGRSISLDLKDVALRNALKMIIAASGTSYNLVIPDEIHDRVTIRLDKVPWNRAFEAVLAANDLWYGYHTDGKLIRVGPRLDFQGEDATQPATTTKAVPAVADEPGVTKIDPFASLTPRLHIDKKVSWSLGPMKVSDFVRMAAKTCGFSAVVGDNIDKAMDVNVSTARCDQAFEFVLRTVGLAYSYDPSANLVWVVAKDELDKPTPASTLPDGHTVDLDLKDAELTVALLGLMDLGTSNKLSVPPDLQKKRVTIRLQKVPWNRGFEAVLASHGLWYRYDKNNKQIDVVRREELDP